MKGRLLILAVLSSLFISDCSPHRAVNLRYSERGPLVLRKLPMSWAFSCEFPEEYRDAARAGFVYWNKILDQEIFREASGCGVSSLITEDYPRALIVYVPGVHPENADVLATTDVGLFDGIPRSAVLRYYGTWQSNKSRSAMESVSRHEVGHIIGFGHSDIEGCLMYPKIDMNKYSKKSKGVCGEESKEAHFLYGKKD